MISRWIKDFNVRPETLKLLEERFLEENVGSMLFDILSNILLDISSGKQNKSKNKQMELNQTKKLLYSEGNYQQNEKPVYWMGKDTCKQYSW